MSLGSTSRAKGGMRGANTKNEREKLSDANSKSPFFLTKPSNYIYKPSSQRLIAGDHIATYRRYDWFRVGYFHHAIYMGNDLIIEFNDKGVEKRSYADFMNSCKVYFVDYSEKSCYPASEVCERAENRLRDDDFGEYHLGNKNCEHFATEVKTGKQSSDQARRLKFASFGFAKCP